MIRALLALHGFVTAFVLAYTYPFYAYLRTRRGAWPYETWVWLTRAVAWPVRLVDVTLYQLVHESDADEW